MFRLAYNPGTDTIAQFVVTETLVDVIETVFGPTDEEGCFKDLGRTKAFMSRSNFLCELIGKDFKLVMGGFDCVFQWEYIIKHRYEDILKKLRDKKHEYTFNEIGEGLIQLLLVFISDECCAYLAGYSDNKGKFDGTEYQSPLSRAVRCPGFFEELKEAAKEVYEELLEDELFEDLPEMNEKLFVDCYISFWEIYLSHVCCYCYDYVDEKSLYYNSFSLFLDSKEDMLELGSLISHDLLFWDDDFLFVLPLLGNREALQRMLDALSPAELSVKDAASAVLSFEDAAYELAAENEWRIYMSFEDLYGSNYSEIKNYILNNKLSLADVEELQLFMDELCSCNKLTPKQCDELESLLDERV